MVLALFMVRSVSALCLGVSTPGWPRVVGQFGDRGLFGLPGPSCDARAMSQRGWGIALIALGFAMLALGAAAATVLILAAGASITLAGSWLAWRHLFDA